ncbi:MAG: hypothetical protein OEV94_05285 [Deltaproteobacteria bacterium]|nr:hypothetical protein [Deltaproteobacteria bacterium]
MTPQQRPLNRASFLRNAKGRTLPWLMAWALAWGAGLAMAQPPVTVEHLEIGEPRLPAGTAQIIQVNLHNPARVAQTVRLVLRLSSQGEPLEGTMSREVRLAPDEHQRVFFKTQELIFEGSYQVDLNLYAHGSKKPLNLPGDELQEWFLVAGGETAPWAGRSSLRFKKPDLTWSRSSLKANGWLKGGKGVLRVDLVNIGGDVARNIQVRAMIFNVKLPNRMLPLANRQVSVLAPGDKIELELGFTVPENTMTGDYKVVLVADPGNKILELTKKNNRFVSPNAIRISYLNLVYPEENDRFEETGMFLFRWESRKFDRFKVQVGVDPNFENPEKFFDLPQGDKWAEEQEITPLSGELPGMLTALMDRYNATEAYWRVIGTSSTSEDTETTGVRQFSLQRRARPSEDTNPNEPSHP